MHPATRQSRTDERGPRPQRRHPSGRIAVSLAVTCLGVLYALYRGYYALGGTVVRIGSTVYDGSVRGRLERLREALVAG